MDVDLQDEVHHVVQKLQHEFTGLCEAFRFFSSAKATSWNDHTSGRMSFEALADLAEAAGFYESEPKVNMLVLFLRQSIFVEVA